MTRRLASMPANDGFTLLELVIAVLILGIITLPLLSAFVLNLGATAEANQRTQDNSDAQLLSQSFERDVAAAENIAVSNPLTSTTKAPAVCGGAGNVVVRFDWTASSGI